MNLTWICLHSENHSTSIANLDYLPGIIDHFTDIKQFLISKDLSKRIDEPWYWFARLNVHKKVRGYGWGNTFMEHITRAADENKFNIINMTNPYGDMNSKELVSFYKKFGFINYNQEHYGSLIRLHY
jgi:predicted GNAT family N-acyltransferase